MVSVRCGAAPLPSRQVDLITIDRDLESLFFEKNGTGTSLRQFQNGTMALLLSLQQRDNYTAVHSLSDAMLANLMAERLDLSPLEIVKFHHNGYDGAGYPALEPGMTERSVASHILEMADSFDAMTTPRVFVQGKPTLEEKIEDINRNRGTQFHPEVVDVCLALLREGIAVSTEIPIPDTIIFDM